MDLAHEKRLTEVEDLAKSNKHRIAKLEESTEAITRLASSMEVMAVKQEQVAETVEKLDEKVETLESKPGQRWESIAEKAIWAICAALIAFILGRLGL